MKSNSWMVVMFAIAVTASIVLAKSLLTAPERTQAAASTQTHAKFVPVAESTKPMLATHRQPPAPAPTAKRRPTAEAKLEPLAAPADGSWTVLVVHGDKREYVTYRSMRRIRPVN